MELTKEFTIGLDADQAWVALRDIERVASLVPGARVDEAAADDCRGSLRVTVGRTAARYDGAAHVVERDEATHRTVVRMEGKESQGHGGAVVTLTATMSPAEEAQEGAYVRLVAEVTVTGRFSRADQQAMADTFDALVDGFVDAAAGSLLPGGHEPDAEADRLAPDRRTPDRPALDRPVLDRRAPAASASSAPPSVGTPAGAGKEAAAALAVVLILLWLLRRRRA